MARRKSFSNIAVVILAAGKGVRMKSNIPKVLHQVCGKPMIYYSLRIGKELNANKIVAVLSPSISQTIQEILGDEVEVAIQDKPLGTGHAVMCAKSALENFYGDVLILYGDMPLITSATLKELIEKHRKEKVPLTLLTAIFDWDNKFGRVIRDKNGKVKRIVEVADASPKELKIKEVNAGIYAVERDFLFKSLDKVKPNNAQGEYYLTDIVEIASKENEVSAYQLTDPCEVLGINDRTELAEAERVMRLRITTKLMKEGVTFLDPATAYIHDGVKIEPDTVIYPSVVIEGATSIGKHCIIGTGAFIKDSIIGDEVEIRAYSVLDGAKVGNKTTIGPCAHLRPESVIGARCRIGNFVETKKVVIGDGTKASHLTYLGDAEIGANVNIGCGTITCNYDGIKKHKSVIEDGVFVGSDTQLVAPVRVGKGAYIGSGSTITKDVPAGALSVARSRQKNFPGWAERKRKKTS